MKDDEQMKSGTEGGGMILEDRQVDDKSRQRTIKADGTWEGEDEDGDIDWKMLGRVLPGSYQGRRVR